MSLLKKIAAIAAPLALLATFAAWSVASPVGSSPDEDYHLASIWCGLGEREGVCEEVLTQEARAVPARLTQAADCYKFKPETSAACELPGDSVLNITDRGNFVGDYPPVFYWTMSLFVGPDVAMSVIIMRLVNAAVFVGLLSALYVLLPKPRREAVIWVVAITLVPLGLFLIPSVNPSSWSITSAVCLIPSLVGVALAETTRRRVGLVIVGLIAAALGSGARSDSAVYTALAAVVAVILVARRARSTVIVGAAAAAVATLGGLFFLSSGQSSVVAPINEPQNSAAGPWALFFTNVTRLPSLWVGSLGTEGLGWLDTALPPIVWVSTISVFAALIFTGIREPGWRRALGLLLIGAALVFVPMYVLVNEQILIGSFVQPRYVYPLLIMFAYVALLGLRSGSGWAGLSRIQVSVALAALSVAGSVALHANLRRYIVGAEVTSPNLEAGLEWWWNGAVSPNIIWLMGTASLTLALILGAIAISKPSSLPPTGVEIRLPGDHMKAEA